MGKCHQIFKSLIYISKKHIVKRRFQTKTELAIKIFSKFESFILSKKGLLHKFIVLVDGGYTNTQVMNYVENSSLARFIGRYAKGRKIYIENTELLLKE